MKKKNFKESFIKKTDSHRFLKMFAAFFAVIAFFTILDDPIRVIEGILDSLK